MKLRTFLRHGKEGLKNLGRNGWMTFASVSSVTIALLLVGFFLALMINLNAISDQIKGDVEVKAYVQQTANNADKDKLKKQIEGIPEVASVKYVPRNEGWKDFINSMGGSDGDGSVFASIDSNPLPDAFEIQPKRPESSGAIADAVKPLDQVSKVNYGKDTVEKLFSVTDTARNIGLVLIIGLLFTAVFLIGNTIKLTIVSRRNEIEIMKLVGATNGFIRWPFFTEGLTLGVLGSVLPIVLLLMGYQGFYNYYYENYSTTFIRLVPMAPTIYYLAAGLLLVGVFIGVWGSVTSVRKFLKV